jgi:hypothetical protein
VTTAASTIVNKQYHGFHIHQTPLLVTESTASGSVSLHRSIDNAPFAVRLLCRRFGLQEFKRI